MTMCSIHSSRQPLTACDFVTLPPLELHFGGRFGVTAGRLNLAQSMFAGYVLDDAGRDALIAQLQRVLDSGYFGLALRNLRADTPHLRDVHDEWYKHINRELMRHFTTLAHVACMCVNGMPAVSRFDSVPLVVSRVDALARSLTVRPADVHTRDAVSVWGHVLYIGGVCSNV